MANELIQTKPDSLALAGLAANQVASRALFTDYRSRKAPNTLKRQDSDLALFADYLGAVGIPGPLPAGADLGGNPTSWAPITWGLVAGFVRWLLTEGYAIGSVNVRLSTVKVYARLAMQAGVLPAAEYTAIRAVNGYRLKEAKNVDAERKAAGLSTRRETRAGLTTKGGQPVKNVKKADPVTLTPAQAKALKAQPDTPQGRRDRLIMCLFLDHGLRVGEVARLTVDNFDLKAGLLNFYRPKVSKVQTHKLTPDTLRAAKAYLAQDAPFMGLIWRGSRKVAGSKHDSPGSGELTGQGLSERAITERVRLLGAALGVAGLSAHDCRHYWATLAARKGTPLDRLQDAGGWNSLAMPARYIEAAKIANEGVNLEDSE